MGQHRSPIWWWRAYNTEKGELDTEHPNHKIISNSFFYKIIFKTSLTHLQMGHTNSCKNMQNSLKKYKIMFGTWQCINLYFPTNAWLGDGS